MYTRILWMHKRVCMPTDLMLRHKLIENPSENVEQKNRYKRPKTWSARVRNKQIFKQTQQSSSSSTSNNNNNSKRRKMNIWIDLYEIKEAHSEQASHLRC